MARDELEPQELQMQQEARIPTGFERWSELLIAAGFLLIGVIILVGAQDIRVTRAVTVSPRLVPQIIGVGILLVGVWYVIDIVRVPNILSAGEDSEDVDIDAPTSWRTLILIGIALTLFAFLVRPIGFALAAAVLFTITSFAMGGRNIVANAVIGLILGVTIYVIFDSWLGVRLPDGPLDSILP